MSRSIIPCGIALNSPTHLWVASLIVISLIIHSSTSNLMDHRAAFSLINRSTSSRSSPSAAAHRTTSANSSFSLCEASPVLTGVGLLLSIVRRSFKAAWDSSAASSAIPANSSQQPSSVWISVSSRPQSSRAFSMSALERITLRIIRPAGSPRCLLIHLRNRSPRASLSETSHETGYRILRWKECN